MQLSLHRLRFELKSKLQKLLYKLKRLIMPLFSRSASFRTPKKPPKRNKSVISIPSLEESLNFTADTVGLDSSTQAGAGSLTMKLGDVTLGFNQGNWSVVGGKEGQATSNPKEDTKSSTALQEENNLLRFKVELLIDMLAASNADCLQLQKELEATKRRLERRT